MQVKSSVKYEKGKSLWDIYSFRQLCTILTKVPI